MSSSQVQRPRFNLVAIFVWFSALTLLVLVLGLGEMRQARQQLSADIAQLNADAKNLLLRPPLLDPDYPRRLMRLSQAVQQLEEGFDLEPRLVGLMAQRQLLRALHTEVQAFANDLTSTTQLAKLLQSLRDSPSTDMQVDRLQQNLRVPVDPSQELVRLRAFLVARQAGLEPGAQPDPFLAGVDNPVDQLRAGLVTIDRFETRRTEVFSLLDGARRVAVQDARALPISLELPLGLAALGGVMLLGFVVIRRREQANRPVPVQREQRIEPLPKLPIEHLTEEAPAPAPAAVVREVELLPAIPIESMPEHPVITLPSPSPQQPASNEVTSLIEQVWLEVERTLEAAIESGLNFERRVKSLLGGAVSQPNALFRHTEHSMDELNAILQHVREGALNMAFGLDGSAASEDRLYAAERLEQHLQAALVCLQRVQIGLADNAGAGGQQGVGTHRALISLQFELEHQQARQKTELGNLSKRCALYRRRNRLRGLSKDGDAFQSE
jgi:hypothetical protein